MADSMNMMEHEDRNEVLRRIYIFSLRNEAREWSNSIFEAYTVFPFVKLSNQNGSHALAPSASTSEQNTYSNNNM